MNGIVASIDALRDGLRACGVDVVTVAPHAPNFTDTEPGVLRLPSLPLPTPTAYRLGVPYLRAEERRRLEAVDIVHAHSPFVTGWLARGYARRRGVPFVVTYHTRLDRYAHYAPFDRQATERAMNALTRRFANSADAVIVPTAAMETRLRELGVTSRIAVVPSAIDVARFASGTRSAAVRAELGGTGDAPLALLVGRLGAEKNVELALSALARVPDARLAIVGDGPHREALEAFAAASGVAHRVRFCGALPRERLPDAYAAADAFVFPSTSETQGLVLAEAMAAGLPVVAADSEASRDVAGPERIVRAEPAAVADALRRALARGRDESAVHLAFSRYTVELQTRKTLALYRELVAAQAA